MATQDLPALKSPPEAEALTADALWRQVEEAARGGDPVMAEIHLRQWLASASALVDRACDIVLAERRPPAA